MTDPILHFYEQLAGDYHLIFADWSQAIERQANALDRLIRAARGEPPLDVLDCTCGIGTQAIGLAGRGYTVTASDLSPANVRRAEAEAARRGLRLAVAVADVRELGEAVTGTFDVVLSCDNALPHLLTDTDLRAAAAQMRARLRDDGLLLASIRDYDELRRERRRAEWPRVFGEPGGRRVVFQVWDWAADGERYTLTLFLLQEDARGWRLRHFSTVYRALQRADLSAALAAAGFEQIRWHMPQDTGYYQPVVTARPLG
jgi:glycine/sarcosine N-methyltransferase